VNDVRVRLVRPQHRERGRGAACGMPRSVVQQEEGQTEQRAAQHGSDAEAPPPSALFPQGSTLLRDQCTRADTGGGEGFLKNLDNRSGALQTANQQRRNHLVFPQVKPDKACDISVNSQVRCIVVENCAPNTLVTRFSYNAQKRVDYGAVENASAAAAADRSFTSSTERSLTAAIAAPTYGR
jgi:hypothetical protein